MEPGAFKAMIAIPRDALTIIASPPETISQKTSLSVTGIPPREFLRMLRAPGFPVPVTKHGKLRLVDRAGFAAYLKSKAESSAHDAPSGADGVLRELGFKIAGGAS